MSKYYTIISMGMVGGSYFSKIYILKNEYKTKKEIAENMKELFDNCTVFISKETIWIIKSILCGKTIESLNNSLGDCSFMIYDGGIFLGREVCGKCKNMVHKILGECKENMFISEDEKKNFFIKKKFLEYKEIPEREVIGQLLWNKKLEDKNKEYKEFMTAMKPTLGDGKTKDIQFKKIYAVYMDEEDL
jgi:hypothetical protein